MDSKQQGSQGEGVKPLVSFVVPCFKLAGLLPECLRSILSQSYENFEILIMDDCSPDNTFEVARSFTDPRVRHIRNEPNLGHLANYNKGIGLSRGSYVWLISADDRLRSSEVLARYVEVMEKHPDVGYACCPAVELKGGQETGVAKYSVLAKQDTIFNGRKFITQHLNASNCVVAASGMVRKSCYETHGAFPLDLPYAGDWYLWSLLALHYRVAYFAEPMVNYRLHELSMTTALMENDPRVCARDDLAVLWRLARKAQKLGADDVANSFRRSLALEYVRLLTGRRHRVSSKLGFSDFEEILQQDATDKSEAAWIYSRVCTALADFHFVERDYTRASEFYRLALEKDPLLVSARLKLIFLHMGVPGAALRNAVFGLRRWLTLSRERLRYRRIGHFGRIENGEKTL
jgi:glycosyltransferase involved in cell wall biosynthesis